MVLSRSKIDEILDLYQSGLTLAAISDRANVSTASVIKYTRGVDRCLTPPDDIDGEIWKPVAGFEGIYSVSDHGRVFCHGRLHRKCGLRKPTRSGKRNPEGKAWLSICLTDGNVDTHMMKVHRLVADTFVPGRTDERNQVNHIDGNPENNRADNLEWVTQSENMFHAYRVLGRTNNPHRKFTPEQVVSIRNDAMGCKKLAKAYGVGTNTIKEIRRRVRYADVV